MERTLGATLTEGQEPAGVLFVVSSDFVDVHWAVPRDRA